MGDVRIRCDGQAKAVFPVYVERFLVDRIREPFVSYRIGNPFDGRLLGKRLEDHQTTDEKDECVSHVLEFTDDL